MGVRRSIYGSGGTSSSPARAGGTTTASAKVPFTNVLDYGVVPDGTTDMSAAFQAAETAAQAQAFYSGLGATVLIPEGKYYAATGLVTTHPGTRIITQSMGSGISSDLSTGSVQIIVGDGQWGLTCGVAGTADLRGYEVRGLHFFEKNAGQALGGFRVLSSSNGHYVGITAGVFSAGTGILNAGSSDAIQAQYNTFTDCRIGTSLVGFENQHGNGTRWIGGYYDGSLNGGAPATGTVAFKITSGDTFRSIGTIIQGADTLIDIGSGGGTCFGAEFIGVRLEVWKTAAIHVRGTVTHASFSGSGDNSLNSSSGSGWIIDSGAADTHIDVKIVNVKSLYTDNGTRTRYGGRSGLAIGGAVLGSVSGGRPVYAPGGTLVGYEALYDSITGVYQKQKLGGTITSTGVTTVVRTLAAPANVGDLILIGGGYGSGSTQTITVTDSKSNTWTTQRHDDMLTGATPHSFVATSVLTTALAAGDTITATFGGSVNYAVIFGYDNAGQGATILDVVGGATGTGTAVSASITTTTDYAYLFSATYYDQAGGALTAGTGFTVQDAQTSTSKTIATQTKTGTTAGATTATGTLAVSADWATSVIAIQKVAGGASPLLPNQTGQSGKFLTTNGTAASWGSPSAGALTSGSNYATADNPMTTAGTYYDGPSVTLPAGTYLLTGSIHVSAGSSAIRTWGAKLWDGTTAISTAAFIVTGTATGGQATLYVSALVSPVGSTTYKISVTSTVNGDTMIATGKLGSYLNYVKIA